MPSIITDSNNSLFRILGGKEAAANNYNWLVLMVTTMPSGQRFMCGGNILTKTKILTAAHCVHNAHSVRIYAGIHQINQARKFIRVKSTIVHEKYGFPNHDIAIAILEKPLVYTAKIGPVCLPHHFDSVTENENLIGLGWGKTKTST